MFFYQNSIILLPNPLPLVSKSLSIEISFVVYLIDADEEGRKEREKQIGRRKITGKGFSLFTFSTAFTAYVL